MATLPNFGYYCLYVNEKLIPRCIWCYLICIKIHSLDLFDLLLFASFYAAVCLGGNLKVADTKRLKLIRRVVGEELDNLETVAESTTLSRQQSVMDKTDHLLHGVVAELRSTLSHRLTSIKCSTEHHITSFLPTAITL